MADIVPPDVRSRMMAGIRSTNTKPELIVRKGLHALGFRYRLHSRRLPGKPDMVFPGRNAAIFVHGCFWHGHNCNLFKWPSTRQDFWKAKIERNRLVDERVNLALSARGWRQGIVWECSLKGRDRLTPEAVVAGCADWLRSESPGLEIRGK